MLRRCIRSRFARFGDFAEKIARGRKKPPNEKAFVSDSIIELEEKLAEFITKIMERKRLLSDAYQMKAPVEKFLEEAILKAWDKTTGIEDIQIEEEKICLKISFDQNAERVYVFIDSEEGKIKYDRYRRWLKNHYTDAHALALMHYFVERGAANLVREIERMIREEEELSDEIKRILAKIKEKLAPLVLAEKL